MGFSLKKLGRGIKKVVKKNKGGLGRLAKKVGPGILLATPLGAVGAGVVAKAVSGAKSLGKKVGAGIETPKSLVPVIRAANTRATRKPRRSKMPGGGKIPTISTPSVGMMASRERPRAKKSLYRTANPKTKRGQAKMRSGDVTAGENFTRKVKKKRTITKPPSAKQIAARKAFAAAAAARRKAK